MVQIDIQLTSGDLKLIYDALNLLANSKGYTVNRYKKDSEENKTFKRVLLDRLIDRIKIFLCNI